MDGERGDGDRGEVEEDLAGDEAVGGLGGVVLGLGGVWGLGNAGGPEGEGSLLGEGAGGGEHDDGEQREQAAHGDDGRPSARGAVEGAGRSGA